MKKLLQYIYSEDKPEFIMMVGLPGSGKSTYIEKYLRDCKVHSSDAIREELFGDVNNQRGNSKVFETLHKRVKEDLLAGNNVVYDATNIDRKRRKGFLQQLNNIPCYKKCILIATPYEHCLIQNDKRERNVPHDVIKRMYMNFNVPWYNEGWDNIFINYTKNDFKQAYREWKSFYTDTLHISQCSKWHTLTLGQHCLSTYDYVKDNSNILPTCIEMETKIAAALHDCGKPFCQTFVDKKGQRSEFAHYYNHENVGAYNSLFYGKPEHVDSLTVAALIQFHMILHFYKDWKKETIEKYEKEFTSHRYLLGICFYDALKLLHSADKNAH